MKKNRSLIQTVRVSLSLAILAFASVASAQVITPITGGDSTDGLNLTGLTPVYAGNVGQTASNQVIQGVTFEGIPNNGSYFSGNVTVSNVNILAPGFSPSFPVTTADDTAMVNLNSTIFYGGNMQVAYNVTLGTTYTLFAIISPGGVGGRPSDVVFYNGDVNTTALVLADDLNVATNNASVVSYTYTATFTGVNTLVVAGSNSFGNAPGGDQNAVFSGFAVATAVPEPGTIGLMSIAGLGMLVAYRRRSSRSA